MTHCRFSCENPRSVWMEDSATFTIAMSRMTMNCTARMSASANHFLLSELTMRNPRPQLPAGCSLSREARDATRIDLLFASKLFQFASRPGTLGCVGKSYQQYCPIAHALDLVGERWSLLVVRELLHEGPLRYSDLHARLDGCGTNILAARLKALEQGGVVRRRRLDPPAASWVYELTEYGEGLQAVLHVLAHWGARSLGPPERTGDLEPGWLAGALRIALPATCASERIEFRIGDEIASADARSE